MQRENELAQLPLYSISVKTEDMQLNVIMQFAADTFVQCSDVHIMPTVSLHLDMHK